VAPWNDNNTNPSQAQLPPSRSTGWNVTGTETGVRPGDDGVDPWEGSEADRPIDIKALLEDDELIESLAAGVVPTAGDLPGDPEDKLRAMLAAWVLDVRPETVATPATVPGPPSCAAPISIANRRSATQPPRYARRLAVAAAMVVLLGSGLAVGAWDAKPGGTLWPVAKVFYAEHATSVQAAADVDSGLKRARAALSDGRKVDAAAAIATAIAAISQVAPEQGHDLLVQQQQALIAALDDPALLAGAIAATPGAAQSPDTPAVLPAPALTDRAAERTDPPRDEAAAPTDDTPPVSPSADPQPANPSADPQPANPSADPQPANPSADPQPANPSADPQPANPSADPQPANPQPADPQPADPQPTDPSPAGSQPAADSGPTDPAAPQPAEPATSATTETAPEPAKDQAAAGPTAAAGETAPATATTGDGVVAPTAAPAVDPTSGNPAANSPITATDASGAGTATSAPSGPGSPIPGPLQSLIDTVVGIVGAVVS
jgi:hypothetical protein